MSRDRDSYGLAENSEILGGRQVFGLRQRFDHFDHGGPVQTAGTVRDESPPIKAGHWRTIPHLESTCTRGERAHQRDQRGVSSCRFRRALNSKAILQRARLIFLLRQHFS